jgi:hypothetical protein
MFRRIKDLFGPGKEPETVTYPVDDLSAILDSIEADVTITLSEKTLKQKNTIRDLRHALKELVQDLASKEREEAYHPKLESIAKNTLPLFARAMLSSLGKDLPEEPEEFYHAASESLKGCVKGLSGQGRYLRGVFPEEMKEIREVVDQIGREMNAMTPSIAEARGKRALLSAVRADLSRLISDEAERKRGNEEIIKVKGEIDREERERDQIQERIRRLKDKVDTGDLQDMREEVSALHRDYFREERALQADLAALSHVFRKGEKVLGRTMGSASARDLEALVDILSESGLPSRDQVIPGLVRSLPLIQSMIASGDLTLKNKEEKELFTKEADLVKRIEEGYARKEISFQRYREKERTYQEIPVLTELSSAMKEEERRERHLEMMKSQLSGLNEKSEALSQEIPELTGKVRAGLQTLTRHPVTLTQRKVS